MALNGTLSDLGIVDLIQFPSAGRKTGELIITGSEHEARLYYEKGTLVHARMADTLGTEVLVEIVDWSEGEFEFRLDVEAEEKSIEMELHRAVMMALKQRDEREQARRRGSSPAALDSKIGRELEAFMDSTDFASQVCVLDGEGNLVAESKRDADDLGDRGPFRKALLALASSCPGPGPRRVFVEDDSGTVVLSRLPEQTTLLVVARSETPLGAVSIGVAKLVARLSAGESP